MKTVIALALLAASSTAVAWNEFQISQPNAITGARTLTTQQHQRIGTISRPNAITGETTYYSNTRQKIGTVSAPNPITGSRTIRTYGR